MVRDYAYQEKLWDTYLRQGMGRLVLAKYQGKIVGGYISIAFAGKCLGMHTGSLYAYRNLGMDDAFTLEVIQWAKENGCSWFSFRGVGTTPSQEAFKQKYKPKIVSLAGYYDLPFKPALYKLFYWAEFTLLPASWPLIIRIRKLGSGMMWRLSQLTKTALKE
jgi:lipid II:glycine glycyltransferase (peptidoglycan interpeptide bridge formation enzyme)